MGRWGPHAFPLSAGTYCVKGHPYIPQMGYATRTTDIGWGQMPYGL